MTASCGALGGAILILGGGTFAGIPDSSGPCGGVFGGGGGGDFNFGCALLRTAGGVLLGGRKAFPPATSVERGRGRAFDGTVSFA